MSSRVVLALARVELRRSLRALVAIGVLAGLAAGVSVGALAVAVRTTTAPERLAAATNLDDARVPLFTGAAAARSIAALPVVRESWVAQNAVGQVLGAGRQFASISYGPPRPAGLFTPVVVHGRPPAPDAAHEVLVTESLADILGLRPGSVIALDMLLPREVFQFDTGFGEPDGPTLDLTVTGIARLNSRGGDGFGPIFAGPAFAERYADLSAGPTVLLRLEEGDESRQSLDAELAQLDARLGSDDETAGFGPLQATYPAAAVSPQVGAARTVLGGGLLLFAFVTGLAGILVTAQALGRLASGTAGDQRIESALGIVRTERVGARLVPATLAMVIAGVVAAGGVMVAGAIEPLGGLGGFEPDPGWRPDLALALVAVLGTAVVVGLLVVLTTVAAERNDRGRPGVRMGARPSAWLGNPAAVVGASFAFARPSSGPGARMTVLTAAAAVAGVVATATFAASMDRLEREPARYGWNASFGIADIKPAELDLLVADPRLRDVRVSSQTSVPLDGRLTDAFAYRDLEGSLPSTVVEGRLPRTASEVALGERAARAAGARTGDQVPLGDEGEATVTGIVVVAPSLDSRLGGAMVLTPEGLAAASEEVPTDSALVAVRDGVDPEAVKDEYNERFETFGPEPPAEVRNLLDLGSLPLVLEGFLVLLAVAALAHALSQTIRRRRRDLAVVRALGLTPSQVGSALFVMATAIALVGVAVGIPVGTVVGRFAWAVTATATGVATDAAVPATLLVWIVPVAVLVACAAATVPAVRAMRLSPASLLREE